MKTSFPKPLNFLLILLFLSFILLNQPTSVSHAQAPQVDAPVINAIFFYSFDCGHCQEVKNELLTPMESEYGDVLNILYIEISTATNYELLIDFENFYQIEAAQRAIPTIVIDDIMLIGEEEIRTQFPQIISDNIDQGIDWPTIPGFDPDEFSNDPFSTGGGSIFDDSEACDIEDEICEVDNPVYLAYFYQTGCKVCSRVEADIKYIQTKYPQVIVQEFNIYDNIDLSQWLAEKAGRSDNVATPAIFLANTMLIGEEEITPASIENLVQDNAEGADAVWDDFNNNDALANGLFENLSWVTIAFAGLIDGLNPCAFATLIFFISYLTLSQRKGKEIIFSGAAFTAGVFLAYLIVGLGFYQVLDLLGGVLQVLSNVVYGLTAAFCLILAILSIRDAFRVAKGGTAEMGLHLPEKLRNRINSRIRAGRNASAFVGFAFVTGLIISMLELACTGQIYLPTIIFMTSQESMQFQAILYLLLYNFMFIVPLIVVFILAYYGTNSKDLTKFLEKHAMKIKIGMGVLFSALSVWLIYSIFK